MRIVFVLGDGRTIEVPFDQVQLTCPDPRVPENVAIEAEGQQIGSVIWTTPRIHVVSDVGDSVKWCEELWKLEDKR
jgi:hypothetical protein